MTRAPAFGIAAEKLRASEGVLLSLGSRRRQLMRTDVLEPASFELFRTLERRARLVLVGEVALQVGVTPRRTRRGPAGLGGGGAAAILRVSRCGEADQDEERDDERTVHVRLRKELGVTLRSETAYGQKTRPADDCPLTIRFQHVSTGRAGADLACRR